MWLVESDRKHLKGQDTLDSSSLSLLVFECLNTPTPLSFSGDILM